MLENNIPTYFLSETILLLNLEIMLILKGVLMIINKSYFVQELHKQNSHTVLIKLHAIFLKYKRQYCNTEMLL